MSFDLRNFLTENKLTETSKQLNEAKSFKIKKSYDSDFDEFLVFNVGPSDLKKNDILSKNPKLLAKVEMPFRNQTRYHEFYELNGKVYWLDPLEEMFAELEGVSVDALMRKLKKFS